MALQFHQKLSSADGLDANITVAKLRSMSDKWYFTKSVENMIEKKSRETDASEHRLRPFSLSTDSSDCDLFIYLGHCSSLQLKLDCGVLLEIDVTNRAKRMIHSHKELRKRVALIEKFKQNRCQTVGIVYTNPLVNNINHLFSESKILCRKVKKKCYFISLMLTVDEYKLGNFAQLDSFVVVNSCICWSALDSIHFCLPVLNWAEFKLASGIPITYGGAQWNQEIQQESPDSDDAQCPLSDTQLIQTDVFDQNKWFGLEVNAGDREASIVKSGQKGIASAYDNETLF